MNSITFVGVLELIRFFIHVDKDDGIIESPRIDLSIRTKRCVHATHLHSKPLNQPDVIIVAQLLWVMMEFL